jgi:hypothetical protein
MRNSRSVLLIALFAMLFTMALSAETVHMVSDASVPAAQGKVEVGHDDNGNTRLHVVVNHMARPERLTPAKQVYVVWIQQPGNEAQNLGTLQIGDHLKAELAATTPLKDNYMVFVTAEDNPQVTMPSEPRLLTATVQK